MINAYIWQEDPNAPKAVFNPNEIKEPAMEFTDGKTTILRLAASGMGFNHAGFPNYTYREAAHKVFNVVVSPAVRAIVKNKQTHSIKLVAYKSYPERYFNITPDGVEHNFDVDTWHWWMFESLNDMIKKM